MTVNIDHFPALQAFWSAVFSWHMLDTMAVAVSILAVVLAAPLLIVGLIICGGIVMDWWSR